MGPSEPPNPKKNINGRMYQESRRNNDQRILFRTLKPRSFFLIKAALGGGGSSRTTAGKAAMISNREATTIAVAQLKASTMATAAKPIAPAIPARQLIRDVPSGLSSSVILSAA